MAVRNEPRVIVVGGGLVGLAAAACMRAAAPRARVTVVEPGLSAIRMPESIGLRVVALTPASLQVFAALGVLERLPEFALADYERMRVWDAAAPAGEGIEFAANRVGREKLGAITDVAALQAALLQSLLDDAGVNLIEDGVTGIDATDREVQVRLHSASDLEAELVVGADGRRSQVRSLSGLRVQRWSHHQEAVVATLAAELSHENTALQRFLPTGPLALLPLRDNHVSLVWSTQPAAARALRALEPAALSHAVSEASDYVLGALEVRSNVASFALESAYVTDPVGQRVVLIGDAAHAIHPLAGQGANLGFADAVALANVLRTVVERRADPGDPPWLRQYRRMRRGDNLATLFGLDFINRLFGRETGALADLRRQGMRWFSGNALAQHLAIDHATSMRGAGELAGAG